jgi:hypothetical protein
MLPLSHVRCSAGEQDRTGALTLLLGQQFLGSLRLN